MTGRAITVVAWTTLGLAILLATGWLVVFFESGFSG